MNKDKIIDTSTELAQYLNELARDSGVPGIGLVGHFCHVFVNKYLESRFKKFLEDAAVDEAFLCKILKNEDYSNCLYSSLETVRRTHSKLGLAVLALIYRDYWDKPDFLISAMRAFAEISDNTIKAFIKLYESISEEKGFLKLAVYKNGERFFHDNYNEAVELINRNIFVQSASIMMAENMPIQGMIWDHTEEYYKYCKEAMATFAADNLMS